MKFKIKTWICECGYKQDFEPNEKNMNNYFPHLLNKKFCPSCKIKKLKKVTKVADKIEMTTILTGNKLQELKDKYK